MNERSKKIIANNKKAFHDFFIEEKYEAGIVLAGTEVKSLRQGKCSIKESYIQISSGEAIITGMNIPSYENGNIFNKDEMRARKLLLHKSEIRKLNSACQKEGYTIVPLSVYFDGQFVKLEIGLAKGKKLYDKRECLKAKDVQRQIARVSKV